jgi:two-component system, cell cycle response regulator
VTGPKAGVNAAPRSTILVVDDDHAIRTMVVRVLSNAHEVIAAADPHEALAVVAKQTTIDLLLLDVMLPSMTGFDLAKRLHLLPPCARSKVIFLSALDTPADKIRGIQAGARSYITKPFTLDDLVSKVNKTLIR